MARPAAKPKTYQLYEEMARLADALHTFAQELRAQGEMDTALKCYEEARQLTDVCARLEKAPTGRTLGALQDTLLGVSQRRALIAAKRRQQHDTITVAPMNGADRDEDAPGVLTEEETHDDE